MAPRSYSLNVPWQNFISQFLVISSHCCLTRLSCSVINVSSPSRFSCVVEDIQPGTSDLEFSAGMPRLMNKHLCIPCFFDQEKETENPGLLEGDLNNGKTVDHGLPSNLTEHRAQEGFSKPEVKQKPSPIDEKGDLVPSNKNNGSASSRAKWRRAGRRVQMINIIGKVNNSIVEKADNFVHSTDKLLRSASQNRIIVWICKIVEELAELQNAQSEDPLANIDVLR